MKSHYANIQAYITRDGSEIRELLHPHHHGNRQQSLAEATVYPGQATQLHRHRQSEEIYHITQGHGRMTLGAEQFNVQLGDTICIPPGTPHRIENTGKQALRILCCCAPPYDHDDTELVAAC